MAYVVDPMRRRLTVTSRDAPGLARQREVAEPTREQLIQRLGLTELFNKAVQDKRRAICIVSQTDKERERKAAFGAKDETRLCPDAQDLQEVSAWLETSVGWTCNKGCKNPRDRACNQDSMSILVVEDQFALYGVYDGHGPHGHDVSEFACRTLPRLFLEYLRETSNATSSFHSAFLDCQRLIKNSMDSKAQESGTTVTMAYHDLNSNKLTTAHVGDSRSVIGRADGKSCWALTEDHKPELPKERRRIESANPPGVVVFDGHFNHRVYVQNGGYPGLNMSRALGDLIGHAEAGLTAEPEVTEFDLNARRFCNWDQVLLLCTDGVWEFVENRSGLGMACSDGIQALARHSFDRWMADSGNEVSDDITGIMVRIPKDRPSARTPSPPAVPAEPGEPGEPDKKNEE